MAATSVLQQQKYKEAYVLELHQSSTLVVPKDDNPSESDGTCCISASPGAAPAVSVKESAQPASNLYTTSSTSFGYYYPGYTGSPGGLDTSGYYIGGNIMDVQYPVMQAEDGSFFYMMPGFHPCYDPYSPCLPLTTIGVEGQYVGDQVYPSSITIQPAIDSNGYALTSSIPCGELLSSPYPWDPSLLVGHGYTNFSRPNHTHDPNSKSFMLSDCTYPSFDVSSGCNNRLRPSTKPSVNSPNLNSDLMDKSYFAVTKCPAYNNQRKSGLLYPNNLVNVKTHGELKNRSKATSGGDMNTLNEKKHDSGLTNASEKLPFAYNNISSVVRRDQYNLPDFEIKYDHAFFFVIKSYSEDDVHKSIKYNVWSSTSNGNKRLDSAYKEAQEKMTHKGSKCPVFLFFSVNASGQFCGLAEMIDRVDFEKNMGFWQQDKWSGYFPVKWHIIKDIPNSKLRHIILENNENKPVTNSRDTQEVKFNKGIEMLSIFKNCVTSTSILDDFDFYESRQKVLQEKRIRQYLPHYDLRKKMKKLTTNFQSFNVSTMRHIDRIQSRGKGKE